MNHLAILGVPSSAGAYAPGQEKAPAALRAIGLKESLSARGVEAKDYGMSLVFAGAYPIFGRVYEFNSPIVSARLF